MLKVLICQIND